jgi:hypothetical protein
MAALSDREFDLALLDLCAAAWGDPNPTYAGGDCRIYRTDWPDCTVLVAAGSATPGLDFGEFTRDWLINLTADWQADASSVLPQILAAMPFPQPLVLAGHSKGGADVQDLAGMLTVKGIEIVRVVTFEAPATGLDVAVARLAGPDYCRAGDPVVHAPLGIPHPRPLTWFSDPPLPEFPDLLANHHIATAIRPALVRYLTGMAA